MRQAWIFVGSLIQFSDFCGQNIEYVTLKNTTEQTVSKINYVHIERRNFRIPIDDS